MSEPTTTSEGGLMSEWLTAPDDDGEESIAALKAELEALREKIALGIVAASGTEAGTGETEGLDPKGDGPTGEAGDTQ